MKGETHEQNTATTTSSDVNRATLVGGLGIGLNYLSYLKDREVTRQPTSSSETDQNPGTNGSSEKKPIAQRIIEAVEKSHDVTMEDAETLLRVIKENQQPVQFKSPLEVNRHENQ